MPSHVLKGSTGTESHSYYTGKFLITKIKHIITQQDYTQEVQIRKDSLSNNLPALAASAVRSSSTLSNSIEEEEARRLEVIKTIEDQEEFEPSSNPGDPLLSQEFF